MYFSRLALKGEREGCNPSSLETVAGESSTSLGHKESLASLGYYRSSNLVNLVSKQ